MATGQYPNTGRFNRRQSPLAGPSRTPRLRPLYPTTLGDERYTSASQTANKLAIDFFWGVPTEPPPTTPPAETAAGGTNTAPWLSFKDQAPQRTRRQLDDEEVLILVAL